MLHNVTRVVKYCLPSLTFEKATWGENRMTLFLEIAVPAFLFLGTCALVIHLSVGHPAPLALGNAFHKLCVVSADEIREYYTNMEQEDSRGNHLVREVSSKEAKVAQRFVGLMVSNAKLFYRVIRFEKLKIDPRKSSLEYDTREILILRLADESGDIYFFLLKAQALIALRSWGGLRITQQAMNKMLVEYKHLEQDFVALVRMASDDAYYAMLVERLGLSNWRLLDGGASETP